MTRVAVIYHSATGRTKMLAEAVARGASEVEGATAQLVSVDEDGIRTHAILATADAIVFGCPTYMGSASAPFKAFMDGTSAVWALQGWRDKLAAGFTHSAALSGDKLGTLTQLAVFAAQHGMVWVGLGLPPTYAGVESSRGADDTNRLGSHLGAMAQSRPGAGVVPESDRATAALLGKRVALAARRWTRGTRSSSTEVAAIPRHDATRGWTFPPADRARLAAGIERTNLREIAARPDRFEHNLIVCARIDDVQLEIATASEPLYFAHINFSDEYVLPLPSGDELVDRFPLRTFVSDPTTAEDVGRYNHRVGDVVLHPKGYLHWPGRLRPPYEPFDFPPGMRRTGLSLIYCASKPTPPTPSPRPVPAERTADVKAYVDPAPPMMLASIRSEPGPIAKIGGTTLSLVELPESIAPPHGGWVVVLEASPGKAHAATDLYRIAEGARLDGTGIVRALVLTSETRGPEPIPSSWSKSPAAPFAPFEDASAGALPLEAGGLRVELHDANLVAVTAGTKTATVPRYWLARMLFRVALHRLALGYVETYGGFFIDDRGDGPVVCGIRSGIERHSVSFDREQMLELIEHIYRAVAPARYVERPA
jgi:NAD(P)H dehydrogenase (quinone)